MGIFSKLFTKKAVEQTAQKTKAAVKGASGTASEPKLNPALPKPGDPIRDMPATQTRDQLMQIWNGHAGNDERIRLCVAMQPSVETWSDAEKSFYYLILGNAIGARSNWSDERRIAFFAASVFYNPINTNSAWHDLHSVLDGWRVSPAVAQELHAKYPLPDDFSTLI